MAQVTLESVADFFPVGTTVGAYPRDAIAGYPSEPIPPLVSEAVDTSPVEVTGHLVFDGLDYDHFYVAHAIVSGRARYVEFRTDPAASDGGVLIGGDLTGTPDTPLVRTATHTAQGKYLKDWHIIDVTGMTPSQDIGPTWQAAIDAGERRIRMQGYGSPGLLSSVFYDKAPAVAAGADDHRDAWEFDMAQGATLVMGGTGLAKADTTSWLENTTTRFGVFVNTPRAALNELVAGEVHMTDANAVNTQALTKQMLRFGPGVKVYGPDAALATPVDVDYGFAFSNGASVGWKQGTYRAIKYVHARRGYCDGDTWDRVDLASLADNGIGCVGRDGDGMQMHGCNHFHPVYTAKLRNNKGLKFFGNIQGGLWLIACHAFSIENNHYEVRSPDDILVFDRCDGKISDNTFMQIGVTSGATASRNCIVINDNADTGTDTVTPTVLDISNNTFRWLHRTETGDNARLAEIRIRALNTGSRLRFRNNNAWMTRGDIGNDYSPVPLLIVSDDAALQTALTRDAALITSGDFELAFVNAGWRILPLPPLQGIITEVAQSGPTLSGVAAVETITTGTLVNGTTYGYQAPGLGTSTATRQLSSVRPRPRPGRRHPRPGRHGDHPDHGPAGAPRRRHRHDDRHPLVRRPAGQQRPDDLYRHRHPRQRHRVGQHHHVTVGVHEHEHRHDLRAVQARDQRRAQGRLR
jgi:hypothetical protein